MAAGRRGSPGPVPSTGCVLSTWLLDLVAWSYLPVLIPTIRNLPARRPEVGAAQDAKVKASFGKREEREDREV